MQKQTTQALILDRHKVNNDIIVNTVTAEQGRLSAVARHARNAKKRFRGHLETLTLVEITYRHRPDWDLARLDDVRAIHTFPIIKGDLLRLSMATVMAEIILAFTRDGLVELELYYLTLKAFKSLDTPERRVDESFLVLFELRALMLAGFLPPLEQVFGDDDPATTQCKEWLAGTWRPMEQSLAQRASTRLERIIQEQIGRPLKSRGLLDEALGWER